MTAIQDGHLLKAVESLAASFERIASVMEKHLELGFPEPELVEDAEVYKVGDEQAEPKSKEEYRSLPERAGRFEALLKAAHSHGK